MTDQAFHTTGDAQSQAASQSPFAQRQQAKQQYQQQQQALYQQQCAQQQGAQQAVVDDSGSFGWAVLGFFIPLVGLILFLCWMSSKPKCAKMSGIGALVGFIFWFVASIFFSWMLWNMLMYLAYYLY